MLRLGQDVYTGRTTPTSPPLRAPQKEHLAAPTPRASSPASLELPADSWDRQDGYHRHLAITVSPVSLSSRGGLDGATLSFSSFLRPLVTPPLALLPADPQLLVPVFAISESESLLPLTNPNSTPTNGVATRLELSRHADATFESVTGKSASEVHVPVINQPQTLRQAATAKLDQADALQRKRRRDVSPSAARSANHTFPADSVTDDKRRAKHPKLADTLAPMQLPSIDELTPRSGRLVSGGMLSSKSSTSPAPLPRSQSRERSRSRARTFDREHNPAVSHLAMPEHTERAWAARKRRLHQQRLEAGKDDDDDDTESLEQLVYPSAFTLIRRQRRHFTTRMRNEHKYMHDMWVTCCHRIRLDQEARALGEPSDDEDEHSEQASSPAPAADNHSDNSHSTAEVASVELEHKSRRRRERSHVTLHANDWMKADFKYVKQDIDSVRRAILEAEACGLSVVLSPKSQSTTPATSPASSPALGAANGRAQKERATDKADGPITLAEIRAELAHSGPVPLSPTPSLMSLSPPSSRSVSPLPSVRTHSTDTSPAHTEEMSPHSTCSDFANLADTQLPSSDKQVLRSLAHQRSHPPGKGGCIVEAIVAHRQLLTTTPLNYITKASMAGDRASDLSKWRTGVPYSYLVQWVESEEQTWEGAEQLQPAMIAAYWDGRGQQLWNEKDISELHRILRAHMRQQPAHNKAHSTNEAQGVTA